MNMDNGDKKLFREQFEDLRTEIASVKESSDKKDEELKDAIHKLNVKMPNVLPCMLTGKEAEHNPLTQISNIKTTIRTLIVVLSVAGGVVGLLFGIKRLFS